MNKEQDFDDSRDGKLKITVSGRLHQYNLGQILIEHKSDLIKAYTKAGFSSAEQLLGELYWGAPSDVLKEIASEHLENKFNFLKKLIDEEDESFIGDEFNFFYRPFVIDDDNQAIISLDKNIIYEGTVGSLFSGNKEAFEEEKENDLKKILKKNIKSTFNNYAWSEDYDLEELLDFIKSYSSRGWHIEDFIIVNKTYRDKLKTLDFEERLTVIEYGAYEVSFEVLNIKDFDFKNLIWHYDGGLLETLNSYVFSNIFYATEDNIVQLTPSIKYVDQKSVTVDFDWPIDE